MEGKALPKLPGFIDNDATVKLEGGMQSEQPAKPEVAAAPRSRLWLVFAFGAAALAAAAAVAVTLHFSRQTPPQAPVVAVAPQPGPAPGVGAPQTPPAGETPETDP